MVQEGKPNSQEIKNPAQALSEIRGDWKIWD